MSFFISVILSMTGTGRVNKDFAPRIFVFKKWYQTLNLLLQMYLRYNSAYVIQRWLKFKRMVIPFRLAYIS